MKFILTIILMFCLKHSFAQYIIITDNNDSIEAKILEKDDLFYYFKRLQKPKKEDYISVNFVKKLIAIGNDTLFNTFSNKSIDATIKTENTNTESNQEEGFSKDFKTQAYWLNKAGEQMNSAITLNLLGTLCIAASPLLIQSKEETKYFTASGVVTPYKTTTTDASLAYVSTGVGLLLNVISVVSWYQCSESLKMASQQQKISFKASPVGASVAFKF